MRQSECINSCILSPSPPPTHVAVGQTHPLLLFLTTLSNRVNKLDGMCRQKELMLRNAVQSHKETVLSLEEKQNAVEKTVLEKERVIRELYAALRQQEGEAAEEMER